MNDKIEGLRPYGHKLKTAAALAGCSVKTLRRAIERGELKASRWMRHIIIADDDLARFVREEGRH